jgi:hypothetical protein
MLSKTHVNAKLLQVAACKVSMKGIKKMSEKAVPVAAALVPPRSP